jgi:hypothetical protein
VFQTLSSLNPLRSAISEISIQPSGTSIDPFSRNVSPMVIRILAVPDSLLLYEFDAVFRAVLGWDHIGFLFRVHG